MSVGNTLAVRSTDVLDILQEIKQSKIEKYREDNSKIEWEELDKTKEKLSLYIPPEAVPFLSSNNIKIIKTSVFKRESYIVSKKGESFLTLHNIPKKEYIKKYIHFLGRVLNNYSLDKNVSDSDFDEYKNYIPYLLEYLYLKDIGKEEDFKKEHLYKLFIGSKRYPKVYSKYYDDILKVSQKMYMLSDDEDIQGLEDIMTNQKSVFGYETGKYLAKLSALNFVLNLEDDMFDTDDYKSILSLLVLNKDKDRSKIVNDLGLNSYDFEGIKKELKRK